MQVGRRASRHRCPEGFSLSRCFCDVSQHGPYPPRTTLTQLPETQAAGTTWGSHLQERPCLLLGCRAAVYTGNWWVSDRTEIAVSKACETSGPFHKLSRGRKYFLILLVCYLGVSLCLMVSKTYPSTSAVPSRSLFCFPFLLMFMNICPKTAFVKWIQSKSSPNSEPSEFPPSLKALRPCLC